MMRTRKLLSQANCYDCGSVARFCVDSKFKCTAHANSGTILLYPGDTREQAVIDLENDLESTVRLARHSDYFAAVQAIRLFGIKMFLKGENM